MRRQDRHSHPQGEETFLSLLCYLLPSLTLSSSSPNLRSSESAGKPGNMQVLRSNLQVFNFMDDSNGASEFAFQHATNFFDEMVYETHFKCFPLE